MGLTQGEITTALAVARDAARVGGAIILEGARHPLEVDEKSENNLVTQIDRASEDAIVSLLVDAFPRDSILAEEGGTKVGGERRWVIDPLDGTTNFVLGIPHSAVSIALEVGGRSVVGVVYDPYKDELFHAVEGQGAYLNGVAIRVSRRAPLKRSVLATGFPTDIHYRMKVCLPLLVEVLGEIQALRRMGAASLDLAYVAMGRVDGFFELRLKPWDVAAGALLVQEAGGRVSDHTGGPIHYTNWEPPLTLATNTLIHDELLVHLRSALGT